MSLTTILSAKDLSLAYKPLLLAEITLSDGTVVRLSTLDFRSATTGVQYDSHDYLPQILNQDLAATQAMSAGGIDAVPSVTLSLADADRFLWTNFEQPLGFKGAQMVLRFVFFDLVAQTFSTDSAIIFVGLCDPPNMTEDTMTLKAVSKMNMVRQNLPTTRIQTRDPNPFPNTLQDRVAALVDPSSPFYENGYSADVTDINVATYYPDDPLAGTSGDIVGFGNLNSGVAYTSADYDGSYTTYLTILGNGSDSLHDNSSRSSGTFAGIRWVPPNTFSSKSYATGKTITGYNATNQNLYNEFIPMVYGSAQVTLPVVSVLGDGNSTRGEALICSSGKISNIDNSQIVVNNVNVNAATDIDGNAIAVNDPLIRYNVLNRGNRNSVRVNEDALFNGQSDCYGGGLSAIEWVVYNQVAGASSVPTIQAVIDGLLVRRYGPDVTDIALDFELNPVWVMLDLLIKSSAWTYADIDIQTFIDAAAVCLRNISYTNATGQSVTRPLFTASLLMADRKSAADWIKAFRTSFRATLVPNSSNNGLLQLYIDQTLADQQTAPITGSNYNTAISSINYAGVATDGYVAYDFSDTNGTILRTKGKSSLKISQTAIASTPNSLSFTFQDSENGFQQDSVTICSSLDVSRVRQEVTTSFTVAGISTYNQAQRIGAWWIAKSLMGNPRGDTGGTLHFSWTTNFKALHLRVGQIVRLSSVHDNISDQLVRLTSVKPSANFETVELEGDWHEDEWYEDAFGTLGFQMVTNPARGSLSRPPFPWLPNEMAPTNSLDPLVSQTTYTFDVAQAYPLDASNRVVPTLTITGQQPINTFSSTAGTPFVRSAFAVNPTGGTLPCGATYSICICAQDGNGYSRPSYVVNIPLATGGTATNSIELTDVTFNGGSDYSIFAGVDPNKMCFQSTHSQAILPVTLTALQDQTWGVPDVDCNTLQVSYKHIEHSGVLGDPVKAVTSTTIQATDGGWTTNQWAGRTASILGSAANMNELKVLNYAITSNTADTLTVTGDPMTDGVGVGDALVIRTLADSFGSQSIGDSQFVNSFAPSGLTVNAEAGNLVRIIGGTGKGTTPQTIASNTATVLTIAGVFDITPDATSVFIVEDPKWIEVVPSSAITNGSTGQDISLDLQITNYLGETLLVQVGTIDGNNRESLTNREVFREVYVFGVNQPSGVPTVQFVFPAQLVVPTDSTNSPTNTAPYILTGWTANALVPATGHDMEFDIKRSTDGGTTFTSIMASPIVIPVGTVTLVSGTNFSGTIQGNANDMWTATCNLSGTTDAGGVVTITLFGIYPLRS